MSAPPMELPATVSTSFDASQSVDGSGSLRIDYEGSEPQSIMLYEVPNPDLEGCTIWCEASLRGAGLGGVAYLEMWCDFGESQFFSRGLDQALREDSKWRRARIPFHLKAGERPERFLVGVRMEGPGTVWLDRVALAHGGLPPAFAASGGPLAGGMLGVFGALCGAWGALGGILAPRGKARGTVVALGWLLTAGAFALFGAGMLLVGSSTERAWPLLLAGGIAALVLTPLNFAVRWTYQLAELRKLAAQDLQ